ncbi:hypothetical protein AX15_000635 [Amanita polypyramis BW_CC]|nr:hypothetical protein AX15_000635 [Amanita polypyramis BW_CC]
MSYLFWRQFGVLFWKNCIVLSKHPIVRRNLSFLGPYRKTHQLNLLRCFVLPVAYGVFLATAQLFLAKPNNYGIGQPIPVYDLQSQFHDPLLLLWTDATDGISSPPPSQIMSRIISSFSPTQRSYVRQMSNVSEIPAACPQNFNWISGCFAAVIFYDIPANGTGTRPVNYTIQADAGLSYINVQQHTSHYEQRILPLQWAIDKTIIELQTGIQLKSPLEWPFTQETNEEQNTDIRISFIHGVRSLLVLALFICYIGIAYQLPGGIAGERANDLTAHMKAMGLLDSARILSWYISISLPYLPAWIIVSLVWHYRIFSASNAGLILVVHLLLGLTLASWSFFIAAPFGKTPQLAAVVTTLLSIVLAILALVFKDAGDGSAFIFTLLFPPGFYVFAIRAICGWENHSMPTNVIQADPDSHLTLLPQLIAAIIDVFLWPLIAVLLEHYLYDARDTSFRWIFWKRYKLDFDTGSIAPDLALSIRNLRKDFKRSVLSPKNTITAIDDLSFDVPKTGIFVLLGSNGAGKSTALSIIGGLTSSSGGTINFEGGVRRPPRGTIGIVPQKNVLFPDLSCIQTLRVWKAVKWSTSSDTYEDLEQLLRDCDLEAKVHSNASTLSGGQKRKLQLAIGLVSGSKIVLVDECTSGVDPLSRRSLWRTLIAVRDNRTIVFTTHFLDEADLLADHIAILVSPGKLVAQGSPVTLKRGFGRGYSIQVTFDAHSDSEKITTSREALLQAIQTHATLVRVGHISHLQTLYHLDTKDTPVVAGVLHLLDEEKSKYFVNSYDILGTSMEDVFLNLMGNNEDGQNSDEKRLLKDPFAPAPEKHVEDILATAGMGPLLTLSQTWVPSFFQQAFTIFYKRSLILRRSWLPPFLTVLIAVAGSTIPIVFIDRGAQTCTQLVLDMARVPLYLPALNIPSLDPSTYIFESPPGILSALGINTNVLPLVDIVDNTTFVNAVFSNYRNSSAGGVSFNFSTGDSLVAWEASPPGILGPSMLNLATNILYNHALNTSGHYHNTPIIRANYQPLPPPSGRSLNSLKWIGFYGAAMSVFPAFFTLYVSKERQSSVQAMQFSNGLTNPLGLWLGHLMFDTVWTVILSTIVAIVFATASNAFHGVGFLWLVLVLYGIAGALFAYCATLIVSSPIAAFALVAGYQIIMFVLYLAGYLLVLTYGETTQANRTISVIHWTLSIVSPVASVLRAALISLNLFSLLCDGETGVTAASLGQLKRFGGPILYLIIYSLVLLALLFWAASGSLLPRNSSRQPTETGIPEDVATEADTTDDPNHLLRVVQISKKFHGKKVVDNVSFGVSQDTIFSMLGPNGAGKTTVFNMIRGEMFPDNGDISIAGISVVRHPLTARRFLGVCPQFTAIDSQMTVREHLIIYGRLKGIARDELTSNVEAVLQATALYVYADRLASKLSGGNQRKLSLAIAIIGNPSVLLIDEFSTGIDAKMKRDMWITLRNVAIGKAVIITTHSMEEASALANRVGILSKRLLAIGSIESLSARYAMYEVHFSCRTREELIRVQNFMARIPGSRMADDVAARFEVPISTGTLSLAQLFDVLTTTGADDLGTEFTVERGTLESAFLKVIRENNVREEDTYRRHRQWWQICFA